MSIIETIASFIADLLGCTEDDVECLAKSRKYATWIITIIIAAIILLIVPKIYNWYKGRK